MLFTKDNAPLYVKQTSHITVSKKGNVYNVYNKSTSNYAIIVITSQSKVMAVVKDLNEATNLMLAC